MATLADAAVEIVAELDSFEPDLRRKLTRAVQGAAEDAEREFRKAGNKSGKAFGDAFTRDAQGRLRNAQGQFAREGEAAGSSFTNAFRKIADRGGRDSGRSFADGFSLSLAGLRGSLTSFAPLLAAGIAPAVAGLVTATAAAVQLSGVVALLPAGLVAAGAAAGTLALGMRGVGDALEAAASGDTEKLNEALKKLSPNARSFVREIQSLTPAFKSLQLGVQEALFDRIGDSVRRLATAALPTLRTGLTGIATSLSGLARNGLDAFAQPASVKALADILGNVRKALDQLRPAIAPIIAAFTTLARIGSGFLPQLATAFTGLAQKFGAFIQQAANSGALADFIQGGIDAAGSLLRVLGNVGRVISGIAKAGAGAGSGLFSLFEQLTDFVADFVNSAEGQNTLASLLNTTKIAVDALLDGLRPILKELPNLASVFGDVVRAIAPLGPDIGEGIAKLIPPLANLIRALLPAAATLAGQFGDVIKELAPVVADLITKLTPLAKTIGEALVQGFADLLPVILPLIPLFVDLATKLADALNPQAGALGIIFGQLVDAAGRLAEPLKKLLEAVLPLIDPFTRLVEAQVKLQIALLPLVTQIADLAASFLEKLVPAVEKAVPTIGLIIDIFAILITKLAEVISKVVDFVGLVLGEFSRLNAEGGPLIESLITVIAATFFQLAIRVLPALGRFASTVLSSLTDLGSTAAAKAASAGTGIVKAIARGLGDLGNAIAQPFRDAQGSVEGAMQSILDAVNGFIDRIQGAISRIGGLIANIPRPSFPGFPGINIPLFGNGTIANRPTLGVIGEAGPEVVIPLTRPQRRDELMRQTGLDQLGGSAGGRGGKTLTVNVPIQAGAVVNADDLSQLIADAVERAVGPRIGIQTSGGGL